MHYNWLTLALLASQAIASPLTGAGRHTATDNVVEKRTLKEDKITPTSVVGAPQRGSPFDDVGLFGIDHKRMQWIEFAGCDDHLTWIHVGYGHDGQVTSGMYHGKKDDNEATWTQSLDTDRIIKVELVTWKKKVHFTYRTRIGHIKIYTKNGHEMACGKTDPNDKVTTWYFYGKSLLYLSGTQGDNIDSLQGHFIPSENY